MIRITKQTLLPLVLLLTVFNSCHSDSYESLYLEGCNLDSVTYSGNVKEIFTQNCALSNCHNTASHQSGVILDTYAGAKAAVDGQRLIGAINREAGYYPMPKNADKLNQCAINKITKWMQLGALNN